MVEKWKTYVTANSLCVIFCELAEKKKICLQIPIVCLKSTLFKSYEKIIIDIDLKIEHIVRTEFLDYIHDTIRAIAMCWHKIEPVKIYLHVNFSRESKLSIKISVAITSSNRKTHQINHFFWERWGQSWTMSDSVV